MKSVILLIVYLCPCFVFAQVITTYAGTGIASNTGDGMSATTATINYPVGGCFDNNDNYYFTTGIIGHTIRKISPSGIISTVAGISETSGFSGDGGSATNAKLSNPQAVIVDAVGNLFVSDANNNRVRKVNIATGIITTVAGTGSMGYSGDMNTATAAMLNNPLGLCFDNLGNLYIADNGNNRVRKVNTLGIISTVAGNGLAGNSINGAIATTSQLLVFGLCSDKFNNLYLADGHGAVYIIKPTGIISYFAGNGTDGFSGDDGLAMNAKTSPYYVVIDKYNNLYIDETQQHRIRIVNESGIIKTIVGNGIGIYGGDGGPASAAQVNYPGGIALDSCGNLYIAESHSWRVRKVTYPQCNYLEIANRHLQSIEISIFPNPTNEEITLENVQVKTSYQLCNAVGSVAHSGNLRQGNNTISVKHFPPGVYLLLLTDEAGKRTMYKIIKE